MDLHEVQKSEFAKPFVEGFCKKTNSNEDLFGKTIETKKSLEKDIHVLSLRNKCLNESGNEFSSYSENDMYDCTMQCEKEYVRNKKYFNKSTESEKSSKKFREDYTNEIIKYSFNRLLEETRNLEENKDAINHEMKNLVFDNYSHFIQIAHVIHYTKDQINKMFHLIEKVEDIVKPAENSLKNFRSDYIKLLEENEAIKKVSENHDIILELLELPQLIRVCVNSSLFDDALNLITYSNQKLYALNSRFGEPSSLVESLILDVKKEELFLNSYILSQLGGEISFPSLVKTIGYLRRINVLSEEDIRKKFLAKRNNFIFLQRKRHEALATINCVQGLRAAADLIRTHVWDSAVYYKTIFNEIDNNLFIYVNSHIHWFENILKYHILPPDFHAKSIYTITQKKNTKSCDLFFCPPPLSTSSLSTLYRQIQHISCAFKKFNANFSSLIFPIFDLYMQLYISNLLDGCVAHFQSELSKYSWIAHESIEKKNFEKNTDNFLLKDIRSQLARHSPLIGFTCDLLQIINELRQCALLSLKDFMRSRLEECLYDAICVVNAFSIDLLDPSNIQESSKGVYTFNSSALSTVKNQKKIEYHEFCQNFANVLLPLVSEAYSSIYGEDALNLECLLAEIKSINIG